MKYKFFSRFPFLEIDKIKIFDDTLTFVNKHVIILISISVFYFDINPLLLILYLFVFLFKIEFIY